MAHTHEDEGASPSSASIFIHLWDLGCPLVLGTRLSEFDSCRVDHFMVRYCSDNISFCLKEVAGLIPARAATYLPIGTGDVTFKGSVMGNSHPGIYA